MIRKTTFGDITRFDLSRTIAGRGRYWTTAYLVDKMMIDTGCAHTAGELEALWEAGIDGVVVAISAGQPEGEVKALRQAIDSLTSLPPRKRGKTEALLPYIGGGTSTVTDTEEDEEEEE